MTDKIRADYLHLKEFTENASHEMQTPLAIIRTNLDLLTQSELQEDQHALITRISQASYRMSSTHRALLLLSKIENQQFREQTPVDFYALVASRLEEFSDFIEAKKLKVNIEAYSKTLVFVMNHHLADILISNLLTNAIKHNFPEGYLDIHFTAAKLTVINSGPPLRHSPEQLFQRFSKDNPSTDSAGLGMAIMKVICDKYKIQLSYRSESDRHEVTLGFQV
nr:HAMP domain-containing sensor histidine kinase [Tunicatimonas sp. TK19036]